MKLVDRMPAAASRRQERGVQGKADEDRDG
jgi:hypothetical protein